MLLVGVVIVSAWRWVTCAGTRELAETRTAYVKENCPDLPAAEPSFAECQDRVARRKAELEAEQRQQHADLVAASASARVAYRLRMRDEQNADPKRKLLGPKK